ncbi:glycosyltransferase family 2 protein [Chloroflexus aggregans]|uniref:Glycosyl transferase family 2 n=1 Tax=Chloroflexus aggregans (strain MD-66 / DSM 9485) TaxID=326427 RepID=B8G5N7_CHLAD|nr:glycosyltransferase family 2 protein [Chloroflexus aggregans]ACL23748.1 glycosyl transferase family 2 [Chloroflexus aggregans DSM 9485]
MAEYNLSIVIPCYNEAEGITAMHDRLAQALAILRNRGRVQLVLVNDGSHDGTGQLLEQTFGNWPDTVIVHHDTNRGLGAALRTGFTHATGQVIVTCDSDGTYPFSEIPALLDRLVPGVDLVTASPYHTGGGVENVPAYRVFISKAASLCYRVLVNPRIHTYTAMFRACRRELIENVTTQADGFLMVTEWLVEALLKGYRVAEYPTTLRVRQYGQSKARVWRITKTHLRYMAGIVRRRLFTQLRTNALPRSW